MYKYSSAFGSDSRFNVESEEDSDGEAAVGGEIEEGIVDGEDGGELTDGEELEEDTDDPNSLVPDSLGPNSLGPDSLVPDSLRLTGTALDVFFV